LELGRTIRSVRKRRNDKRKKDLVHFHISCLVFGSLRFGVMDHGGFVRDAWIPPLYACLGVSINGYFGRLRLHWLYVHVFVNVINWYRGYQCSLSSLAHTRLICSFSCGILNRPRFVICFSAAAEH